MKKFIPILFSLMIFIQLTAQDPQFVSQEINNLGFSLGMADLNGDYLDDIFSASSSAIRIFYQREDGTFRQVDRQGFSSNSPSWSIAAGDIDGNGLNDLLYGGGSGVSFMMANEVDTTYNEITQPEFVFSQRSNFVDINNDGLLDAFVCHDVAPNVYFINDGIGGLTFNQGGLGDTPNGGNYGSVWIDYDNDNDVDLFIAKCRGGISDANINQLHRNNGDGTFTEVGTDAGLADPVQTWSSAWGDFDNDGDMDALVGASNFSNGGHKLMQNNGDGTFTDITNGSGFDILLDTSTEHQAADFNNDGFIDILGSGSNIMVNNGDMTFSPVVTPVGRGALGDANNDGFIDIVHSSTLYLNSGNNNNYIKLNMVGQESNKNGIGAKITVETASKTQLREVRSGEGFRYMSSLNPHFGLGTETEIERILVQWPSGTIDEIVNIPINSTLTVIEGESTNVSVSTPNELSVSIYPNPALHQIGLLADFELNGKIATVYNAIGQKVKSDVVIENIISITDLTAGVYILELNVNNQRSRTRFIKE